MAKMIYMKVPKGFKIFYFEDEVLLDGASCGLKQVAMGFWKEFLRAHEQMGNSWSSADPCLFYNWSNDGSMIW